MRCRTLGLVVLLFLFLAAGCGDSGTGTNSGPSGPSSPTVTSVTITGTFSLGNIGQTSQLNATAHFAKGTTQSVTTQANWSSSDAAIAVVSATGLVTSVGVGIATITATFQGVSGSTRMTVARPASYVVSGVVTESVPTTSTMLSGVRIELTDAANQGRFATTDSAGRYEVMQLPAGTYSVHATLPGYVESTREVTLNTNLIVNFALVPTPRTDWPGIERLSSISSSDPGCAGETRPCRVFSLDPVHNAGPFEATVLWDTADTTLALQLYNVDTGQVVASVSGKDEQSLATQIQAPGNYQVRVVALSISGTVPIELHVTLCPN